ncbi:MAG: YceI family protein, partial [Omnitrophica WOR_2 bacterium]
QAIQTTTPVETQPASIAPSNNGITTTKTITNSTATSTNTIPSTGATSAPGTSGNVVYTIVPGSSANYRVREQLANINFPSDAVGKTQNITGSIALKPDGSVDSSASKFVVNITDLTSDKSMRDRFVQRNILQTSQYPEVVFVPTQVTGLPSPLPTSGPVNFKLSGNLTIMGVTKPVTWDVTGNVQGNQLVAQAKTSFTFEDFNIPQPQVPVVLSVNDNITLELNVTLQRQ